MAGKTIRVGAQQTQVDSGGATPTNGANIADATAIAAAASVPATAGAIAIGGHAGFSLLGKATTGVGNAADIPIGADSVIGRIGSGNVGDVSMTAAGRAMAGAASATAQTALLDLATTSAKGLAPIRSGLATTYLDGTNNYSVPPGTGGGTITSLTTDVVASGSGAVVATIQPGVVTNAKRANMAASTLSGNATGSPAVPTDLTAAAVKTLLAISFANISGTLTAAQFPALTGDVTTTAGSVATTISNDAVTFAKMQNATVASILVGRGSASGAGDFQEVTLGTNLSMVGTTLNATPGSGGAPVVTLTAGAGLIGGGDTSANRTFAVGANVDGSIVVNADDIQVGTIHTGNIADGNVTFVKIEPLADHTVLGSDGDGTGNKELVVVAPLQTTVGSGLLSFRPSAGFSVLGKSTTGSGAPLDVVAGTDTILGRNGSGDLLFGQVHTNQIVNSAVTFVKIEPLAGHTLLGNDGDGTGNKEIVPVAPLVMTTGAGTLTLNGDALSTATGTIAIPYTFSTTTTDSDPGSGNLRLNSTTQNTSAVIRVNVNGNDGVFWQQVLDHFVDSAATTKGILRLVKKSDTTKWIMFNVTGYTALVNYRNIAVTVTASTATSPFINADSLILSYNPFLPGFIQTGQLANNAVDDTKIRQSVGLSVVGRTSNTTGNVADIVATSAAGVALVRNASSTTVSFDKVAFSTIEPIPAGAIIGNDGGVNEEIIVRSPLQIVTGNGELTLNAPAARTFLGLDVAQSMDLLLSFGSKDGTNTDSILPQTFGIGNIPFFLQPRTLTGDIAGAYIGASAIDANLDASQVWDWPVAGTFTKCQIELYVYTAVMNSTGGASVSVVVTKDGLKDTSPLSTSFSTTGVSTNGPVTYIFTPGTRIGVIILPNANVGNNGGAARVKFTLHVKLLA